MTWRLPVRSRTRPYIQMLLHLHRSYPIRKNTVQTKRICESGICALRAANSIGKILQHF